MGLLRTASRAAVASSVHGRVQRRQQQRWAQPAPAQQAPAPMPVAAAPVAPAPAAPAPAAPPAPAAAPASDMTQQLALLAQLNELRQAGALTDEEFEAKKAQVLQL